jgi:hypothetical protein
MIYISYTLEIFVGCTLTLTTLVYQLRTPSFSPTSEVLKMAFLKIIKKLSMALKPFSLCQKIWRRLF